MESTKTLIEPSPEGASLSGKRAAAERVVTGGGLLAALATCSCCIVPLLLFSVGAGGAWIGNLTALSVYKPFSATVAIGLVGYGFYLVYGRNRAVKAGDVCARRAPKRVLKAGLWTASLLVAAAIGFPYYIPFILEL